MKSIMLKVTHITTVHPRKDIRIFHKECLSLARAGYSVNLIVNDGKGAELSHGVNIVDLGGTEGRLTRMFVGAPKALFKSLQMKSDVYHFHDPELMIVGFILSILGRRVIYDVHEDLPNNILNKNWLKKSIRPTIARAISCVEKICARRFSGCVVTTPHINDRFLGYGARSIVIKNYPGRPEKSIEIADRSYDTFKLCYAGLISEDRGIRQMVSIACKSETRLNLMGRFQDPNLLAELEEKADWEWVDYKGILTKAEVESCYLNSHVGLAILHPDINYINSLPIKMFEYMMFGLPVICSNFPNWEEIVESANSGVCVDPLDENEIVKTVQKLKSDIARVNEMSVSGRQAVAEQYNWEQQFLMLDEFYQSI